MGPLIKQLHDGNFSCVIANQGDVRKFTGRGISDLYDLYKTDPSFLNGALVADKVIGKGAATLMISGNVSAVYADLISQSGLDLLRHAGIPTAYKQLVPYIENRDKTDWCPLEKRCGIKNSITELLATIEVFIKDIRT